MPKLSFLTWIKNNKLATVLLVVVAYLVIQSQSVSPYLNRTSLSPTYNKMASYDMAVGSMPATEMSTRYDDYLPPTAGGGNYEVTDRMITTDTSLSLKVDDVPQTLSQINTLTTSHQGFMVNQNINQPEEGASGYISVRVKSSELSKFLSSVRDLGVKVVSENVSGSDITDQYTNTEERLRVLNTTKVKFEEMLRSAFSVSDMLEVQRELLNLQTQIDRLEGQRRYLAESADYSLVSVYLATDEMALPYAPAESWSAKLIFRQAVRSLVLTGRGLAAIGIWAVVFSPIWLVGLGVAMVVRKRKKSF